MSLSLKVHTLNQDEESTERRLLGFRDGAADPKTFLQLRIREKKQTKISDKTMEERSKCNIN